MEVMSPGTKNLQSYMINRLLVHMCREFRDAEKRHLLPCIRADELQSQFPYLSEVFLRKKLKEHANLQVITLVLFTLLIYYKHLIKVWHVFRIEYRTTWFFANYFMLYAFLIFSFKWAV